jgi:hypothetical protein
MLEMGTHHRVGRKGYRLQRVGCNPHKKGKTLQEEEARKKRKYTKEDPIITLTEDDVDFIADKV